MKIYFVHQGLLSFVRKDLDILRSQHDVRIVDNFNGTIKKIPHNLSGILWSDLVFCWFGSQRFVVPLIFAHFLRRKIVIVAGGYDVVSLKEIGYGNSRGRLRNWLQKRIFKVADKVICISESNKKEAICNVGISNEKIKMIYHGFEAEIISEIKKEPIVITVGRVSEENLLRKGIGAFIEAARILPRIQFFIIGSVNKEINDKIQAVLPSNVLLTGYVNDQKLGEFYSRAKVYVQASMHEGFGCSVAEAMLHECVPVVSDRFALKEVVGGSGYFVKHGDIAELAQKILKALDSGAEIGKMARARIENEFSLKSRKKAVLEVIDSLNNINKERVEKVRTDLPSRNQSERFL